MFSRLLSTFFSSFLTLLLSGVFLGNLILIYSSLMPLLLAVLALAFEQPKKISVKRAESELSAYVDDEVSVSLRANVEDGVGLVTLADTIPEYFELRCGNNFRVFWKGFRKRSEEISYRVKCTKRGVYAFGPVKWESRHVFALRQTVMGLCEEPLNLTVKHKPLNVRRMRNVKTISKIPLPLGSSAKLGITTTDFREIRDYAPGDPYRHINWKATARFTLPHKAPQPKVNEFEREGKKVVWIFLDRSASMALGPIIRSTFEYAVEAATGLSRFYLERDCKVGLCIFNGAERIVFPDVGRKQYHRILRELIRAEVEDHGGSPPPNLKEAVKRCRGHLLGANPLSIVITSISPRNFRQIIEGVREIRKYTYPVRSRRRQIIIINVMGYEVAARSSEESIAANLLGLRNRQLVLEVKRAGASVIQWNPKTQSFARLLLAGLRGS